MVNPDDPDYDIYRDSLLRYAGYANEVGEAFRAQESDQFSRSKLPKMLFQKDLARFG